MNRYGVDTVTCAVQAYSVIMGIDCEKELRAVLKSGECFSLKHLAVTATICCRSVSRGRSLAKC